MLLEGFRERTFGALPDPEGFRYGGGNQLRVAYGGERHEEDARVELVQQIGRNLQPQARLARPPRPREREQPNFGAAQETRDLRELLLPANQRGELRGQVVYPRVEGLQGREARRQVQGEELEDPLGPEEVFKALLPEVPQGRPLRKIVPG